MNETTTFGSWLRQRRKAFDLTQEQLADRVSCSLETIRKIEAGTRRPSREMVELLAQRLAVPADERSALVEFARLGLHHSRVPWTSGIRYEQDKEPRPSSPPTNLPRPLTSFVGRRKEMEAIRSLLWRVDTRLVTLTGAGGSGKTRLGIEVAADLCQHYQDGVFFVSLAPITDPALVVSAIARVLGVRESGGQSLLEGVQSYLGNKHVLLLLDNFEQVLEATPAVAELLSANANLKVLVTSREPLHLYGEHCFPVSSLQLPGSTHNQSLQDLYGYEAVDLFVQRAMLIKPDFALTENSAPAVTQICQRLDGLPLAIELAVARLNVLPPQAMLSRMENRLELLSRGPKDMPARQQTLRNTIEWSYWLLSEDERILFRRLAVFSGGCTFEAMQSVCGAPGAHETFKIDVIDVLEAVASLIDKSLVRQEEDSGGKPRFWMLETIREYAWEKLMESEEWEALRRQHATYFLALAEEAEPHLRGSEQEIWLARLEDDHDNFRAAFRWVREDAVAGNPLKLQVGLRMAAALWRFWDIRSYQREGREHLAYLLLASQSQEGVKVGLDVEAEVGVDREEVRASKEIRAKTLNGAGNLALSEGDYATARSLHREALTIRRELGDKQGIAGSLNNLANATSRLGEHETARHLYEESLEITRELGDKYGISSSLYNLGAIAFIQGDYQRHHALKEESLAIARELGDTYSISKLLDNFGFEALYEEEDHARARGLFEESLALKRELGDKRRIAHSLNNLGRVAYHEGDYARARGLFEESLALHEQMGNNSDIPWALDSLGLTALREGDTKHAGQLFTRSLQIDRMLGDKRRVTLDLLHLAAVAAAKGEIQKAARLLGALDTLRQAMAAVLDRASQTEFERTMAVVRAQLGESASEQATQEGRAMSMEEAIEYSLGGSVDSPR